MDDFFDNWTVQLRKGFLELAILSALQARERYGYALVKSIVATPGLHVAEGSIYPLLSRLRRQGLVETRLEESPEGPARKYYHLTGAGVKQLKQMEEHFQALVDGLRELNDPPLAHAKISKP